MIIIAPIICQSVNVSFTKTTPATMDITVVRFAKIDASETET